MSRVCAISGKKPAFGRNVSHSKRRTNRRFEPNVQSHRVYVPELGQHVRLQLSTHALRTINRKGVMAYLRDEGLTLTDIVPAHQRRSANNAASGQGAA